MSPGRFDAPTGALYTLTDDTMVRDNNSVHRLFPLARFILGIIIIFLIPSRPSATTAQTLTEDHLGEGLSISIRDLRTQCPDIGPLVAIEIDPARYRFTVHYYQQDGFS